ncbi:MAG: hypothetical protein R2747_01785 [Pyrinomonadaceae bacterium]
MNLTKTILITAVFFILSVLAFGQSEKIKIGFLDETEYDNCGTSLSFSAEGKIVFFHGMDGAWMRINGKNVNFKFFKSTIKVGANEKKGDKFTNTYTAQGYKLSIKYTIKGFEEDVILYNAIMTLTKNKSSRTVNLVGWSGC